MAADVVTVGEGDLTAQVEPCHVDVASAPAGVGVMSVPEHLVEIEAMAVIA
ncbi:hypothetical protein [Streptomyces pratensis]|uniref:hypothetical protein n=1 Tax=Streptomyces pratensis TaxID=1169025 RepID=UPI0019329CD8|nr:hypothetical protein [Streptomyces pratensis]